MMNARIKTFLVGLVWVATIGLGFKSEITPIVKMDSVISNFSLVDVSGKIISLNDYKKAKGLIVIFTCNRCPFAKLYVERMNKLNANYTSKGFPLIAINATDAIDFPEESIESMKILSTTKKFNFPYLKDSKQLAAKSFGANKTPHAFVLLKENKQWKIKYSGAIDDNGVEPEKAENKYLENAILDLLSGKEVAVKETRSIGCSIKYKNNQAE
jgi:glutathione peroxidase-family protein